METVKIVINNKYGAFELSDTAKGLYKELSGVHFRSHNFARNDPYLIEVIEKLGAKSSARYSKLIIKTIPSSFKDCYVITEYDGLETIDLSPHLLINHKLKQMDVGAMTPDQCTEALLLLQRISSTNYYI